MKRLLILSVLLVLTTCHPVHADNLTIITAPTAQIVRRPSSAPQPVSAVILTGQTTFTPLDAEYDTCKTLTRMAAATGYPDKISVPADSALWLLIQPQAASGLPQDYSSKLFWSWFLPNNSSDDIALDLTITATPGLLDIRATEQESLKFANRSGTLVIKVLQQHDTCVTLVTSIIIPLEFYPTVTRRP